MSRYKKIRWQWITEYLFENYLPNNKDNIKQLALKILFLILIFAIVFSGIYFGSYYYDVTKQNKIIDNTRNIFENNSLKVSSELLKAQNSDYKAWLKLENTELNNPIYQCSDNRYYLNKNSLKKENSFGTLFLDYRCEITKEHLDKNLVIYGSSSKNGTLFSSLHNLRLLSFYKNNSVLSLFNSEKEIKYKVFAVFVLNASKKDDGGYIYNIYRNEFFGEEDFNFWAEEAKSRSVINTNVDVNSGDNILTLVTNCNDFENARLVVMARSERAGEILSSGHPVPTANKEPMYPKKWYIERDIEYPFKEDK